MSEYTPDESADTSPEQPGAEVSSADRIAPQMEQAGEAEPEIPAQESSPIVQQETPLSEQADETAPAPKPEDTLPPEAQGEANGGPLGCCLGIMVGLLLSLSLAVLSRAYASTLAGALQGNYGLLGLIVRILMGILAFALAIGFGYVGWKLGRRFYREYEPPVRKRRSKAKKLQSKA